MALTTYHKKRNFRQTSEPKGELHSKTKNLRFVVQKHAASHLHYDFRLEMEGVLKSWAVPKGPSMNPHDKHLAIQVEDHPYEYRTFHGTIPKGNYGAGTVEIWDEGTYEPVETTEDSEKLLLSQLKKGDLKFILHGKKLTGKFALVKFGHEDKNWLLIKEKDSPSLLSEDRSGVKKKKTSLPLAVKPMLAYAVDAPFNDPDWIYEIKWDGYRALAQIEKNKVRLYSRNNLDYTNVYSEIVHSLEKISHTVVLDGEIVVCDKTGKPQFQLLQEYRKNKQDLTLIYYVFDLLYLDGYDLRGFTLIERKSLLKKLFTEDAHLKYSDYIEKYGLKLFALAKKKNVEGIIAKKKTSLYISARSRDWLKIKNIHMQEAIICGFTEPKGSREDFGALILGIYDHGNLRYVGHTGSGFDEKKLKSILHLLKPLIITQCPFSVTPQTNAPATWVKPKLVCQIKFSEWTKDGSMRQPIFLGLRDDKEAKEVETQDFASLQAKTNKLELKNLTKVFWPKEGFTKGDLISYYERVAPLLLPHLKDRPQSLNRHPDGIEGESFFQKDITNAPDWIKTVPIYSDVDKRNLHWLLCNDKETLLYLVNLGCIEINPWNSRYQKKNYPDYLILDLDPEDLPFSEVINTARHLKKVMDRVELDGFLKTSGKRGLHILIPLGAKYTYDQTRQFAQILAQTVSAQLPHTTSVVRDPKKREKKVYIDYLQNRVGQTLAAPYCVRPIPLAPVSTPLLWSELNSKLHPTNFTMKNVFKRLDRHHDLWKSLLNHKGITMQKSLVLLEKLPGAKDSN